jgi:2'-5' RNA ligase
MATIQKGYGDIMSEFKDFYTEGKTKGTYAAVRIRYAKCLRDFLKKELPDIDVIPEKDMHCTLLYSRKFLPDYEPDPKLEHKATITGLEVWDTFDKKRALVARLKCPSLVKRHKDLMEEHKATYDYDEYKPHFTISYDIGDTPKPKLNMDDDQRDIVLTDEYDEELKLEWKPKS